ncbi:MAG: histidinol-phosphatase HisJ family protein [Herbinix sp.]|nr:histidinol-phosphatase HisJ family protein [Herbinix sp.]
MECKKADYHVHSIISPDAKVPMIEMCESAYQKGLSEIVFTDHYEFYAHGIKSQYFHDEYIKGYFRELEKCREFFDGKLLLKSGMEFGQPHLEMEKSKEILDQYQFDYLIGSVHKLDNIDLEKLEYREETVHNIAERYYLELLKLSEQGEFDCMGHLDLFKRHACRHGFPDEFERHELTIRRILKNLIERGKGIEINTSGIRQEAKEAMPSLTILKMYKELGGKIITVGSDAHQPQDIGADFDIAYELLRLAGFDCIMSYNKREASAVFIEE